MAAAGHHLVSCSRPEVTRKFWRDVKIQELSCLHVIGPVLTQPCLSTVALGVVAGTVIDSMQFVPLKKKKKICP